MSSSQSSSNQSLAFIYSHQAPSHNTHTTNNKRTTGPPIRSHNQSQPIRAARSNPNARNTNNSNNTQHNKLMPIAKTTTASSPANQKKKQTGVGTATTAPANLESLRSNAERIVTGLHETVEAIWPENHGDFLTSKLLRASSNNTDRSGGGTGSSGDAGGGGGGGTGSDEGIEKDGGEELLENDSEDQLILAVNQPLIDELVQAVLDNSLEKSESVPPSPPSASQQPSNHLEIIHAVLCLIDACQVQLLTSKHFGAVERSLNSPQLQRFCTSLAEMCSSSSSSSSPVDISFIFQYRNVEQRCRTEVAQELVDLALVKKDFVGVASSGVTVLERVQHAADFVTFARRIRASLNKLYYLVTEWMGEDRDYTERVRDTFHEVRDERDQLEQRIADLIQSQNEAWSRTVRLRRQAERLNGRRAQIRVQLKRCRLSVRHARAALDHMEQKETKRGQDVERVRRQKERCEEKLAATTTTTTTNGGVGESGDSNNRTQLTSYQLELQLRGLKSENQESTAKLLKTRENATALRKHVERLEGVASQLTRRSSETESELSDIAENRLSEAEATLEQRRKERNDVEKELRQVVAIYKDLAYLLERREDAEKLKLSSSTTSSFNTSSTSNVAKSSQQNHSKSDKMTSQFRAAANVIGAQWRDLYLNLEMRPDRTREQRLADVDQLDRMGGRNDITEPELCVMALRKWRQFHHRATQQELVKGIRATRQLNDKQRRVVIGQFQLSITPEEDEEEEMTKQGEADKNASLEEKG